MREIAQRNTKLEKAEDRLIMVIEKKMAIESEIQQREREISRLEIDIEDLKVNYPALKDGACEATRNARVD